MSCSGLNIFGDDTCESGGGGGLTPGQEQDLNDVVEKTQLQSFVSPNTTDFIGNLTVNGLPVGGGGNPFDQSLNTSDDVQFEQLTVKDSTGVNPDNTTLKNDRIEFRGDPINTSLGSISYQDGAVYKVISMGVNKGDFTTASQARIVVDGQSYLFQDSGLNMNSKKIVNLTNPLADQDAATKVYVDESLEQSLTDPVIKTSVTIENDIAANTLVLTSSQTTGFNLIESISGPLDINSTDLTINLNATLTENIGSNKLSTISGNMTELISANKVLNVGGNNLSNASLHQITGPIVNNASLTTPILNGIDEINSGGDININNIGGQLIIANDTVVVNSFEGIDMTGTNGGIQVGGGRITTTNVAFTNDDEMVTKKYIDDNDSGFTQAFSATILIDDAYIFPQQNLDFNGSSTFSLFNFYSIPVSCKLISLSFLSNTTFSRTVRVIKNFQSPIIASVVVSGNAGVFPFATPIEFIGGEIVAFRIDRNNSEPIDENIITAYFEKTDNASPAPNIIVNSVGSLSILSKL